MGASSHPAMDDIIVSCSGVAKLLRNLKPHKAAGPDGVPARLLKEVANELAPAITLLFQASINQGRLPAVWKKAMIFPLFKKGNRSLASNYRPISLTAILCKLCEHIVHFAVVRHLTQHNILTDVQHGLRRGRSCDTQLILTEHDLVSGLDEKQQTDLILPDFSKAFDKVPHKGLSLKSNHYGICGTTPQWIRDFLSDRIQQVIVDGRVSSEATSGVPQGSVLGPLLFLIYINYLPSCTKNSTVRLFTDDCVLYRQITSRQDTILLQKDLDALQQWEHTWMTEFNPSKCQVVQVTNKRKPSSSSYSIHGQILDVTISAKYLGVHLDANLNFNTHVDATTKKANSTRAFLARNFSKCSRKIKEACYTTYIRPIVEYATTTWDPHTQRNIKKVEQVQRSSDRFVTNIYDRTHSVTFILNDIEWSSLRSRRVQNRLAMLYRVRFGLVDIDWRHYLTKSTSNTRGHGSRLWVPYCSTEVFSASFFPRTIRDWNALQFNPAEVPSLDAFKSR